MSVELHSWMARLESRHLENLQFSEVVRALRAVSSAYVERRHTAIAAHRVLDGAGKRAAFALYYAPLHFLGIERVLAQLTAERTAAPQLPVIDLGCGTGAAGAATALATGTRAVLGIDTHPWALDEARDTYAAFGLDGTVTRASAARVRQPRRPSMIVAGHVANEMRPGERAALKAALVHALDGGSNMLVVEPLARSAAPWWPEWVETFVPLGARADEWKLRLSPPDLVQRLGEAAGLTAASANLRTLHAVWPR